MIGASRRTRNASHNASATTHNVDRDASLGPYCVPSHTRSGYHSDPRFMRSRAELSTLTDAGPAYA